MAGSLAKALLVGGLLGLLGCAHRARPTMVPAEQVRWRSADGWTGPVYHYPPAAGVPARGPALLMHGMGANHYNWDYQPSLSLAAWLQARGWDVWVPGLRGEPDTVAPDRRARRNYAFDDYALQDVPAIVQAVRARTGEAPLTWIGHSMGGLLLYTTLAQHPDWIAAGVAIASPVRFQELPPLKRAVRAAGRLIPPRGLIHTAALARLVAPLGHGAPGLGLLMNRQHLDAARVRGLARVATADQPRALTRQVSAWLRAGSLVRADGQTPWLRPADVPVLVIAGQSDWISPPEDAGHACAVFPRCEVVVLSDAEGGPWGHIDLVLSEAAAREVYPRIGQWLERLDATAPPSG